MPVHGTDPHAGAPGHLVDRDGQALGSKDLCRRLEDLGPVATRVSSERP